jgi:hypothetical protein
MFCMEESLFSLEMIVVFENLVQTRVLRMEGDEVTREQRHLRNDECHNL